LFLRHFLKPKLKLRTQFLGIGRKVMLEGKKRGEG